MTGEQIRRRGLVRAAVGAVLVAWVVVVATLTEVGTPHTFVAAAVSAGLVCLCPVASGLVAARITDAASATRLRHVFVVLDGAALSIMFLVYWISFSIEPVERPDDFAPGVVAMLVVPVVVALVLGLRLSLAVHEVVVEAGGPLVPDAGDGAPAQRIRVLGSVLVVAGVALAVGVVAVSLTAPSAQGFYLFSGLLVTLAVVLLGISLTSVTDVHVARRKNPAMYLVVVGASGSLLSTFAFETANAVLLGALEFGAVVLIVAALVMMREYTGEWDRPWRERRRAVSR